MKAIRALAFALAAAAAMGVVAAERRVALLIGNNAYNASPLQNAVNDARDLGAALRNLGFTTVVRENATRREMIEAIREFGDTIAGADAALFFYSGHALQFKDRNFLVPVDSEMRSEEDIALFSLDVAAVFDRMERARTARNILILDACRDNPFAGTFKMSTAGLATASAPSGTLIAYATAPGALASDGGFGRNGVYTKHILQNINAPRLPVELMFKKVREGVEKETLRRQTPWDASSLKGDFSFSNADRSAAAPLAVAGPSVDVQLQIEREFWVSARDSNQRAELLAYLQEYPEGKFVVLAKLRLQKLGGVPEDVVRTRGLSPASMPAAVSALPAIASIATLAPLAMQATPLMQVAAPAAPAVPPAAPAPSVEDLFRQAQIADMQLSPDGKRLAALSPVAGRQNLVVMDIATRVPNAVTAFAQRDVVVFRWVNDRRLILQTGSLAERMTDLSGAGMVAIDADGKEPRPLTGPQGTWLALVRTLPGDTDDIIVQQFVFRPGTVEPVTGGVYRMNTRNGRMVSLGSGRPEANGREAWVVDNDGVARAFAIKRRGATAIYYRAAASAPWRKLDEYTDSEPGWAPIAIAEDGKALYVTSWKDRDKAALRLLDPDAPGPGRIIASHPYVDVQRVVLDYGKPVGISYEGDRLAFAWFDEELERIQSTVDTALPRAVNELGWSRERTRVLVKSFSDVSPGTFYLFDRATGKIEWLAERSPWIKPEAMSPTRAVRYRARDGMDIPAYLTLPRNGAGKRHPMVVLVHRGPWTEGASWRFDAEVQHLASRGYAVLQPNYRGTLRYGWKHYRASFRQWGRAMQDDVADGAAWAIAQGHADKDRICIAGSGYGGYSALMGVVATPDLFKCAVSQGAVTDIAALFDIGAQQAALADYMQFSARETIGDPDREADYLNAVSPLRQAAKIRAPVLMAYGAEDTRVPPAQGERLRAELEKDGRKNVWIVIPGEDNAFRAPANQARYYKAVEQFLGESIGSR